MEACGDGEAVFLVRLGPVPQFAGRDVGRRRQPLELGEELLDADGLGGINQRFGELPGAVGAVGPDFQLSRGPDLHAGDRRGFQVGQDFGWGRRQSSAGNAAGEG